MTLTNSYLLIKEEEYHRVGDLAELFVFKVLLNEYRQTGGKAIHFLEDKYLLTDNANKLTEVDFSKFVGYIPNKEHLNNKKNYFIHFIVFDLKAFNKGDNKFEEYRNFSILVKKGMNKEEKRNLIRDKLKTMGYIDCFVEQIVKE